MVLPKSYQKLMDVRIDFFTTEQGGRAQPAIGGEYRTVVRHEGLDHSCVFFYDAGSQLMPGQSFKAKMSLLMQDIQIKFKVGDPFALWEGKIFAVGVVENI
jgi:hypothetical protein